MTAWSSTPWSPGPRTRRPASWSGCSWRRGSSPSWRSRPVWPSVGGRVDSAPGRPRAERSRQLKAEARADAMATTSSSRRSRSDRAGHGKRRTAADAPKAAASRQTADDLGADQPGEVHIVACHGGRSTTSADVREIEKLLRPTDSRIWIDLAQPSKDEIRIVADAL